MPPTDFSGSFKRWARCVRRRRLAWWLLAGITAGMVAAAAVAALLWCLRDDALRHWSALLALAGAVAGLIVGARRRWSDLNVALYLDARLASNEAIATAVQQLHSRTILPQEVGETVVHRATKVLQGSSPKAIRPRLLRRYHGLAPLGLGVVIWVNLLPLPPPPPHPPPAPGTKLVKAAELRGLDPIIALGQLEARDVEQRERLQRIAAAARRLRADLGRGLPRRDALARIAKLRDEINAERLHFGDLNSRAGLEAAVRQLKQSALAQPAAKALGRGDLTEFDRQMQQLANQAETADREAAQRALDEAAKAARQRGARQLADSLEQQQRLWSEREAQARALSELGEALRGALSEEALRHLEEFGKSGSLEAERQLADALLQALSGLSEEERKRLAAQLRQRWAKHPESIDALTESEFEELARRLETPGARKQLADALKRLARPQPAPDAARERELNDAERGGAQAQRQLGGLAPLPLPGGPGVGSPHGHPSGNLASRPGSGRDRGGRGNDPSSGGEQRGAQAPATTGKELRAKAQSAVIPGATMRTTSLGRTGARAGETANQVGSGALGQVGPKEIGGVEHSQVPAEYREQVGRYFEP